MALLPSTLTIPRERRRLGTGCWCSITRRGGQLLPVGGVLPGRYRGLADRTARSRQSLGTRAIDTLSELIDFLRALRPLLPRDYSVFGHSMGR